MSGNPSSEDFSYLKLSLPTIRKKIVESKKLIKELLSNHNVPDLAEHHQVIRHHQSDEFCIRCTCDSCDKYREDIILLVADQIVSVNLWKIVRSFLRESYRNILSSCPPNDLSLYNSLTSKETIWRTNGYINESKPEFLDHASDTFSKEMEFIYCSSLLQLDDSHQLLELLSYEVECIIQVYWSTILERRPCNIMINSVLEENINYILQGYEKLCATANKIGAILFNFEEDYLKRFNLTWLTLNKRIYQKLMYPAISEMINYYLSKRKIERPTEFVKKILMFNNDMINVSKAWKIAWEALHKHHMCREDKERRLRVRAFNDLFEQITRQACKKSSLFINVSEWKTHNNRQDIWQNVITYIKHNFMSGNKLRLNMSFYHEKCISCKMWSDNHKSFCKCATCLIAGPYYSNHSEDLVKSLCYKCALVQKAINEGHISNAFVTNFKNTSIVEMDNHSNSTFYHIAWIVFKQAKGRPAFCPATIDKFVFCRNCPREDCMLSKKIINNEIDKELIVIAMLHFRSTFLTKNEVELVFPNILLYFNTVLDNDTFSSGETDNVVLNNLWGFCWSVFLRQVTNTNEGSNELNLDNLQIVDGDIVSKAFRDETVDRVAIGRRISKIIEETRGNCGVNNRKNLKEASFNVDNWGNFNANCIEKNCSSDLVNGISSLQKKCKAAGKNETLKNNSTDITGTEKRAENMYYKKVHRENQYRNMENWIKQTVHYIEGDRREEMANRKAEKKIRQKLKKEEVKRVEELQNLKLQYHDIYFKELAVKNDLKILKSTKKKGKKKILELESSLKKLSASKSKIEKNILELLRIVKLTNTNFKMSYLPTKEDQKAASRKKLLHNDQNEDSTFADDSPDKFLSMNQANISILKHEAASTIVTPNDSNVDPSKRIVTIRRVNIPNLAEPQVTVTAKGASPEDDKLLYTFINGQIIPASSLDSQMRNILSSQPPATTRTDVNSLVQIEDINVDVLPSLDQQLQPTINKLPRNQLLNINFEENFVENIRNSYLNNEIRECKSMRHEVNKANLNNYWKCTIAESPNVENTSLRCSQGADENEYQYQSSKYLNANKTAKYIEHVRINNQHTECKANKSNKKNTNTKTHCASICNQTSQSENVSSNVLKGNKLHQTETGYSLAVATADNILCQKVQSLSIDSKSPAKLRKENMNISIMEQINRGVKVEELMLPPGITLTKVNPANAEKLRSKKKSIETLSYPMMSIHSSPVVLLPQDISIQTVDKLHIIHGSHNGREN